MNPVKKITGRLESTRSWPKRAVQHNTKLHKLINIYKYMIKKFQQFIKESYDLDLLAEIEQRFIIFDDMDIDYTIEEYISVTNNFNTYRIGYKIVTNDEIEYDKIKSIIRYFTKYYKVDKFSTFITITEEKILTKDEVLNMLLTEEQIKKVEEFSQDIFSGMIKKDNVWYLDKWWIFELDEKNETMWYKYDIWWLFFKDKIGLEYQQIQVISKALLEEHLNYNVFTTARY
jgi:hypothetical protein